MEARNECEKQGARNFGTFMGNWFLSNYYSDTVSMCHVYVNSIIGNLKKNKHNDDLRFSCFIYLFLFSDK